MNQNKVEQYKRSKIDFEEVKALIVVLFILNIPAVIMGYIGYSSYNLMEEGVRWYFLTMMALFFIGINLNFDDKEGIYKCVIKINNETCIKVWHLIYVIGIPLILKGISKYFNK